MVVKFIIVMLSFNCIYNISFITRVHYKILVHGAGRQAGCRIGKGLQGKEVRCECMRVCVCVYLFF